MLASEFIDRTGYKPTAEEYAEIEKAYYVFNGDKDAFCRAWCKEGQRKSKVFDKLVVHIIQYARRKDFDPNMLYYMDYADRSAHVDFVCSRVGAKDCVELHRMITELNHAHAVTYGWSPRTWEYYRVLTNIC